MCIDVCCQPQSDSSQFLHCRLQKVADVHGNWINFWLMWGWISSSIVGTYACLSGIILTTEHMVLHGILNMLPFGSSWNGLEELICKVKIFRAIQKIKIEGKMAELIWIKIFVL